KEGYQCKKRKKCMCNNKPITKSLEKENQNQIDTSTSDVSNVGIYTKVQNSIENGGSDSKFFAKLMISIRSFDESYHAPHLTCSGHLFLPQLTQEMRVSLERKGLWHEISWAQEALNIPFLNLLLILHPETSNQEGVKAELMQDGVKFLTEIIYKWCNFNIENDLKPLKKSPNLYFDVSEPSYLLQYTSRLSETKFLSLTTLWKLWKRWFRCSTYSKKKVLVGIREFAGMIRKNLMKLKSNNWSIESETLQKDLHFDKFTPLQLGHTKTRILGDSGGDVAYTWRDYHFLTVRVGKYQYELLTLRDEVDRYFDQLQESLTQKCLSEEQVNQISPSKIDKFIKKLYNELTPCFLGTLLALKSQHEGNMSVNNLVDDGWTFFKSFLDLLARSFSTNESDIGGVDCAAQGAISHILSFSKRCNNSGPFSLKSIFQLLTAWFNQSSLQNKQMVQNPADLYALIKIMHDKNEFPVLVIK
ncbi:hypothetical protein DFH28DRAFT_907101, partial [Melampsora americana]